MQLTFAQKRTLYEQGFVSLPESVPQALIHQALRAIHRSLGECGMDPAHLPILRAQTYCPEITATEPITDLLNTSPLWSIAQSTIGTDAIQPVRNGQIALRFPTMNETPLSPNPHIDGMYTPTNGVPKGEIRNFTALIGVFLSDIPHDFMGNLTIWPGTHQLYGEYFKENGPQALLEGMPPITLPQARQVTARAGDAILCHYLLGHGIAGNVSPFIRYAVFFRLLHKNHEQWRWESMTDIWREWAGMQEIIPMISSQ